MAIEPIKGFYVHDEATDIDGVAKYDYNSLLNTPDFENLFSKTDYVLSYNKITSIDTGHFYNLKGWHNTSSSYSCTADIIPVSEGDVVRYYNGTMTAAIRYVTAYDANGDAVEASGAENIAPSVASYTVPAGIAGVRVSWYAANTEPMVTVNYAASAYQAYFAPYYTATYDFLYLNDILNKLHTYNINANAYRPLGVLSKGYICLVSDDGNAELATYTIPMLINKEVPATFAVMAASHCWEDNTNKATVIDAVNNHGCEIAQHGATTWNNYNEKTLIEFFDSEKVFFDTLGLTPYGAVCPAHIINNSIRAIAGGRFGCVRTGYGNAEQYYPGYLNGERSNQFGLTSFNIVDGTLSIHQTKIDEANTNHWLYMIHFHENEMDASERQRLEAVIDYAKQSGITFITMKDIPSIV